MKHWTYLVLLVVVVAFSAAHADPARKIPDSAATTGQLSANSSTAWAAPASVEVIAIDKSFSNGPGVLRGTLYAPAVPQPVPAIIVFHAASTATRDAALFRHLIEMLPPLGVAVFLYDRRGSGQSDANPAGGDFQLLAGDGLAAAETLAQDPRVDSKRIGCWGLSQGGWLSLLAASNSHTVSFAIAVSAPITTADVQMNFAVENILRIKGFSQADIDIALSARMAVDEFQRGRLDRATAQQRLDQAAAMPWFDLIYMERTFADPGQSGWAKELGNDPLHTLLEGKAPTLLIYGAADPWVPVRQSLAVLAGQGQGTDHVQTTVIADADHFMMQSIPPASQIDPGQFSMFAPTTPAYFSTLASWLTARGIAQPALNGGESMTPERH